jgi:hypothetical protein
VAYILGTKKRFSIIEMDSPSPLRVRGVLFWDTAARVMVVTSKKNAPAEAVILTGRQIAQIPRQLARSKLDMAPLLVQPPKSSESQDLWTVSFPTYNRN